MSLNIESSSIKLKRHTGSAGTSPTSLQEGEFAINLIDGHFYYGPQGGGTPVDKFAFGNVDLSGSLNALSGSSIKGHFNDPLQAALRLTAPFSNSLNQTLNRALIATGTLDVTATSTVTSSIDHHLNVNVLSTPNLLADNLVVTETASINYLHTIQETASIIFTSGSTTFGNTLDDLHRRTGSVEITGSLKLNGAEIISASYNTGSGNNNGLSLLNILNFDDNITVTQTPAGTLTLQFGAANLPTLGILSPSTGNNIAFISNRFSKQSCSYELRASWDLVGGVTVQTASFEARGFGLSVTGSVGQPYNTENTYSLFLSKDGNSEDAAGNDSAPALPLNQVFYRGLTTGSQSFTASIRVLDGAGQIQLIKASMSLDLSKGNPTNDLTLEGDALADITVHNAPDKSLVSVSSTRVIFEQGLSASIDISTSSITTANNGWVGFANSISSSRVQFQNRLGGNAGFAVDSTSTLHLHNGIQTTALQGPYFSTSSDEASSTTGVFLQASASVYFSASYTSSGAPSRTINSNVISANDTGGTPNNATISKSRKYEIVRSIRTFASPSESITLLGFDFYSINAVDSSPAIQSHSVHFLTSSLDGFTYQNEIPAISEYPDGLYQWILFDSSSAFVTQISEGGFDVTGNYISGTLTYGDDNAPKYRFYRKKVQDGAKSTTITFTA